MLRCMRVECTLGNQWDNSLKCMSTENNECNCTLKIILRRHMKNLIYGAMLPSKVANYQHYSTAQYIPALAQSTSGVAEVGPDRA